MFLKQSTNQDLNFGCIVSSSDGFTPISGAISTSGVFISKNGGAFSIKSETTNPTNQSGGHYQVKVNDTDTNTPGRLRVYINASGALPHWHDYMVLPAHQYDSLIQGSDYLQVDVLQWSGVAVLPTISNRPSVYTGAVASNATSEIATTVVASGNAAGWNAASSNVTVTGLNPFALSQIVTSGNAAGWGCTDVVVSGISNGVLQAIADKVVVEGNLAGWTVDISSLVESIWEHTVDVVDAKAAIKLILAYAAGNVSRTSDTYTYKSYNGLSDVMVIAGSNNGRTVNKS